MTGEILSVDFIHPDCDDKQMVLHIRAPIGGVTTGKVFVSWSDVDPCWRLSMLQSVVKDLVDEWDRDGNVGLAVDRVTEILKSQGVRIL